MLNLLHYVCVPSYCFRHILTVFKKKKTQTKTYLLKEIKLKSLTHHLFSQEEKPQISYIDLLFFHLDRINLSLLENLAQFLN